MRIQLIWMLKLRALCAPNIITCFVGRLKKTEFLLLIKQNCIWNQFWLSLIDNSWWFWLKNKIWIGRLFQFHFFLFRSLDSNTDPRSSNDALKNALLPFCSRLKWKFHIEMKRKKSEEAVLAKDERRSEKSRRNKGKAEQRYKLDKFNLRPNRDADPNEIGAKLRWRRCKTELESGEKKNAAEGHYSASTSNDETIHLKVKTHVPGPVSMNDSIEWTHFRSHHCRSEQQLAELAARDDNGERNQGAVDERESRIEFTGRRLTLARARLHCSFDFESFRFSFKAKVIFLLLPRRSRSNNRTAFKRFQEQIVFFHIFSIWTRFERMTKLWKSNVIMMMKMCVACHEYWWLWFWNH